MAPDAPIRNMFAGALIGQIGGYPPFAIGDQRSITAPVSGRLYLGVNDDHLPDNRGEFTVGRRAGSNAKHRVDTRLVIAKRRATLGRQLAHDSGRRLCQRACGPCLCC